MYAMKFYPLHMDGEMWNSKRVEKEKNEIVWYENSFFFAARIHKKKLFFSTTRLTTCVFEDVILLRFFFLPLYTFTMVLLTAQTFHMRRFFFFSGYMSFCEKAQRLYLQPMCSQTR